MFSPRGLVRSPHPISNFPLPLQPALQPCFDVDKHFAVIVEVAELLAIVEVVHGAMKHQIRVAAVVVRLVVNAINHLKEEGSIMNRQDFKVVITTKQFFAVVEITQICT